MRRLEEALKHRKVIQGYGKLYHWKFADRVDQAVSNDEYYLDVIKKLHEVETPDEVLECFDDIMKEYEHDKRNNVVYISRGSIGVAVSDYGDAWELQK